MPRGLPKNPIDLMPLEGGGGGMGGGGGRLRAQIESMTPAERAALESVGNQFRVPSPVQARAQEKARKAAQEMSPKERKELESVGEQFRVRPEGKKKGGAVSASRRADGIARRGKTKGRMV